MQVAVHQEDADILLKQKNILNEDVVEKYRVAGQITQTGLTYLTSLINNSYHLGTTAKLTIQQLCLLTDSFLTELLSGHYNKKVDEKGISSPTTINVNELLNGFAPEIDDERGLYLNEGDVVTVSLGVQIDGYTSNLTHTLVIYPTNAELKPNGPLLGNNADAISATHIATEAVVALLGTSLSPEKLPNQLKNSSNVITGTQIRQLVDAVAACFNCTVVPGSKVRRIRRFLAGQAEGIVAERDFKGVVWDESHQEASLLKQSSLQSTDLITQDTSKPIYTSNSSAIPTDEFVVVPGEVYHVDIRMCGVNLEELGIVTTEEIDHFTGKNNKQEFTSKASIFVRDFAVVHQLKLKTSRKLLGEIDKSFSVYPFKLDFASKAFPIEVDANEEEIKLQINQLREDLKTFRLGAAELSNRHLIQSKPIQITKFVPLKEILLTANPTGKHGIDAAKPVLPGMEIPLPQLNISSIKLRSLLKKGHNIANVREATTVLINSQSQEVLRLNGGETTARVNWIHSQYKLSDELNEVITHLVQLTKDSRFGIKVKDVNPYKLTQQSLGVESMQMD
ncbi:Arx1 ribosomal large subunit biogenesis protein [Candida orthopsilosis Co 90-125]|uniref:Probable metalloprotease ARX1 n=1 Tax=Candida orthopsilosis (strain 90-125) TaxID=1136231 RepID=H8X0G1_CANO9|nr:Arx1 ribosomal large subunit biogenesis protein [Candida orthopsilosis Co 90-125]CCG22673.1 Arx1 ribosomal large subunit biogenesis protein [Candida orthopsilosis Co 90-125]